VCVLGDNSLHHGVRFADQVLRFGCKFEVSECKCCEFMEDWSTQGTRRKEWEDLPISNVVWMGSSPMFWRKEQTRRVAPVHRNYQVLSKCTGAVLVAIHDIGLTVLMLYHVNEICLSTGIQWVAGLRLRTPMLSFFTNLGRGQQVL